MIYHAILITDVIGTIKTKPLGPYSVANVLRQKGLNVLVLDMASHFSLTELEQILKKTISKETLFLGWGLTIFFDNIGGSAFELNLISKLNLLAKDLSPNIKTIVGGAQIKNLRNHIIKQKDSFFIDYLMLGFGESMIVDFVNSIRNNKSIKFSNVINNTTKIIDYDIKASNHDFRFTKHIWHTDDIIISGEPLPIEMARGCIFKCKFCSYPMLGKNKNDLSYLRHEENLLYEVLYNYENFKTLQYLVVDDTFNERTDKLEILLRVRDKSKLDLSFSGYSRLDLINAFPVQIDLFKDLNWLSFSFGIETFNHRSAKAIGKGLTKENALETMYKIKTKFNNKVHIQNNFIIGLPYDTPNTVNDWTSIIFQSDYPADAVNFHPLYLIDSFEPSDFFYNIEKYGYRKDKHRPWAWFSDDWSFDDVIKLTNYFNLKISNRNKLSTWKLSGAIKLGFTRNEVLSLTKKEIENKILSENLDKKYFNKYKENLMKHLNIQLT